MSISSSLTMVILLTQPLFLITSGAKEQQKQKYFDCGGSASLQFVELRLCHGADREVCHMKTNSLITLKLGFIPTKPANTLTTIVNAVVAKHPLPFYIGGDNSNACLNLNTNTSCPIRQDENYFYSVQFPVLKNYPRIRLSLKWRLVDDQDQDVICIEFPTKLIG